MNKKIAIIDDEQDILDILEKFLSRSEKFDISTYSNPKTALDTVKSGSFDLVLLDIMMPQMNGLDFLKELKDTNPNIKVIMMTAYSTLDKVIESNKVGAEDYVTKPFVSLRDVENKILDNLGL
ncbi:MAG: response regulator [Campylobacterota bacterium]|nr:response regulator [Campylobacterota bacterium]